MEDIVGWLLLVGVGLVVLFYVCWILLALLLRIFAWIVFCWAVAFSLGVFGGLITGLVIPFRVLSGRSATTAEIATPERVVEQQVIKHPPRGFTRHFGWDRAWPAYNPYQSQRDSVAVREDIKTFLSTAWARISGVGGSSPSSIKNVPCVLWSVPYLGFFLGAWVSFAMWFVLMLVIGSAVYLAQQTWILGYRWLDRGKLFRAKASVMCHKCYATSPFPSYHCINPACGIIHRDVFPGPLGLLHRRCECGEIFPTTVGAASRVLMPVCPICGEELAQGSGARQTIQLPAFGAVGAGKTRLFAAGLVAVEKQLIDANGALEPLGAEANGFLKASARALSRGSATDKTIYTSRPAGWPMKLNDASGRVIELQLMDASGESFANWHTTEELTYVNVAPTMVFVLDPLALPRVKSELTSQHNLPQVLVAAGDQEDAYASVVDRLRSEDVKLNNRHLAVVITKTDILQLLPSGRSLDPSTSDTVRDWLIHQDQDGFVRRIESDFGNVRYFAVDLLRSKDLYDPLNPIHVFQWVFQTQKVAIALVPASAPEPTSAAPQPQKAGVQ